MTTAPSLAQKKCVPCEGGVPPLSRVEADALRAQTPAWTIDATAKGISRTFRFRTFAEAMAFLDAVARLAEEEHHHPDLRLHDFRLVTVTLSTHAVGGLSENDFILAAKVDQLEEGKEASASGPHFSLA